MIACRSRAKSAGFASVDDPDAAALTSAPAQEAIVTALRRRTRVAAGDAAGFVPEADILGQSGSNRASLTALIRKGIVEEVERIQGLHRARDESGPGQSSGADPGAVRRLDRDRTRPPGRGQHSRFCSTASPAAGKPSSICAPPPGAFATANQHSCSCRRSPCHRRSPTGSPPASATGWRCSTPAFPTRSATPPGRESPPGAIRWWSDLAPRCSPRRRTWD